MDKKDKVIGVIMKSLMPTCCSILLIITIVSPESSFGADITAENLTIINESDPVVCFFRGEALFNESRYNESIEAYNKAIELNQSYKDAWHRKGRALRSLEKYNDSIDAYDRAIDLDPNWTWPWSGKANTFYKMAKYNESIMACAKANELVCRQ
jgi:superkiller protein 3